LAKHNYNYDKRQKEIAKKKKKDEKRQRKLNETSKNLETGFELRETAERREGVFAPSHLKLVS